MRNRNNRINDRSYRWIVKKLVDSKMNVSMVLGAIVKARGDKNTLIFRGRDVGLKGAQLRSLVNLDIIKIVGKEDIEVYICGNRVIKQINVYEFDSDIASLLTDIENRKAEIKEQKLRNIDGQIAQLQTKLERLEIKKELLNGIDRAYNKGWDDAVSDSVDGEIFNYLINNPYPEGSNEFDRYISGYEDGYTES